MMKILLIFSLALISVPIGAALTGYVGGTVVIRSNFQWDSRFSGYLCKWDKTSCNVKAYSKPTTDAVQGERFLLFRTGEGFLSFLIKRLKLQDAGRYEMRVQDIRTDVPLIIVDDSCCAEPKSVSALPGQNITMIFNYPVENKRNYKYIVKLDSTNAFKVIVDTNTKLRKNRFSVSEDRRAQVASLSISNVKKVDDGVYFCGVGDKLNSYLYFSFFSETQLHVKADEALAEITSDVVPSSGSTVHIIIIISVCVCLALLLTGGFAVLIYKMRHRITQGLRTSTQSTEQPSSVYENELPPYENLNSRMTSNCPNLYTSKSQSDSAYQTLEPVTNQADSGYTSLTTTTGQSHSQYQGLNPQTRANSVYHNLQS